MLLFPCGWMHVPVSVQQQHDGSWYDVMVYAESLNTLDALCVCEKRV